MFGWELKLLCDVKFMMTQRSHADKGKIVYKLNAGCNNNGFNNEITV